MLIYGVYMPPSDLLALLACSVLWSPTPYMLNQTKTGAQNCIEVLLSLVGTCILNHGVETLVATLLFTAVDDSDIVFPPK
jgi:hypothetical protein